jgi:putative Mg2+ transporter-C (MgtC) family protein
MDIQTFTINLVVAMALGAVIGLERQLRQKSAGLRTNILVSMGAALYVLISLKMTAGGEGDVTRIIGQIVTGVGFIGGGIIFKKGADVHGLTTAATVWCSSAIGSMAGAGMITEAAIGAGLVLVVNVVLTRVDKLIERRRKLRQEKHPEEGEL